MESNHHKVIILGSGPAGLTAAIYAARANLKPLMICGNQPGGQMTITTDVENYPGFADIIQGPWLMDQMQKQAEGVGTEVIRDIIIDIKLNSKPFECVGDSGKIYRSDSVIISTGASAKWLGLESEKNFMGFGVSACATCDGFFFRDQEVCVIGGGNTAVEEALYLTNHAKKVYLIHRREKLRAEKILQKRLFDNNKIEIIWNSKVNKILGENNPQKVTGVELENLIDSKIVKLSIDGVFVAIGHSPNTKLFKDKVIMDEENYIITKEDSTKTNINGVFACGDVQDKIYRQAVTAAGTGCMAALEVDKYLSEQEYN